MFERFIAEFVRDSSPSALEEDETPSDINRELEGKFIAAFFHEIGSASFRNGVYRTFSRGGAILAAEEVAEAFPQFAAGRSVPIGRDWLNRIYAADYDRLIDQMPAVTIFSHFTDEVFELPSNIDNFHNFDLVNHYEELLQAQLFRDFMRVNHLGTLAYNFCASFEHPLFLGGDYTIENMRVVDTSVDWAITAQMLEVARNLDPGDAL